MSTTPDPAGAADPIQLNVVALLEGFQQIEARDPGASPARGLILLLCQRVLDSEAGATVLRDALIELSSQPNHFGPTHDTYPCQTCRRVNLALKSSSGAGYHQEVVNLRAAVDAAKKTLERMAIDLHLASARLEVFSAVPEQPTP